MCGRDRFYFHPLKMLMLYEFLMKIQDQDVTVCFRSETVDGSLRKYNTNPKLDIELSGFTINF